MKLKKAESPVAEPVAAPAPSGGAVIADRFKLDTAPVAGNDAGVSKTSSLIALVCSLAAIAMLSAVAALMYVNWDLIKDV